MSFYSVSSEKCVKCGICVDVCPVSCFMLNKETGPEIIKGMENYCISCGHCVSVCPEKALSLDKSPLEKHMPLDNINFDKTFSQLASIRSIRRYEDKNIPRDVLKKILNVGTYAPTAVNTQNIHYFVFEGREKMKEVTEFIINLMRKMLKDRVPGSGWFMGFIKAYKQGIDRVLWNAPALVLAAVDKNIPHSNESDAHIALTYLSIYANSLGIGNCWAGYIQWCARSNPEFKKQFNIPENFLVKGAMMFGYPKYDYKTIPARTDVKINWLD